MLYFANRISFMIRTIFYLALGVFMAALMSCGDDNVNDPGQNVVLNDTSITTGRLIANVNDANFNRVNNASVWLYVSYEDLERNLPVFRIETDNNGRADFGFINTGNYYLYAAANRNGNTIRDTVATQIIARKTIQRTLVLR